MGSGVIERYGRERHVADCLDQNAPEADHQQRPPSRIAVDAENDLATRRCHWLHEDAIDARRRRITFGGGQHPMIAVTDGIATKVQSDRAGFSFVRDVGRLDLECDWLAYCPRRRSSFIGRLNEISSILNPDAVGRQQWSGPVFAQHRTGPCQERADFLAIRYVLVRCRTRAQQALAQGAVIGHRAHCSGAAIRAGEQGIARLVEDLDAAGGRQGVGPHEHRLGGITREILEFLQIVFEKS